MKRKKEYGSSSHRSTFIYLRDSIGRLKKWINITGSPSIEGTDFEKMNKGGIIQDYKYDELGNVIEIKSTNSGIRRFTYEFDDQNNWIKKF